MVYGESRRQTFIRLALALGTALATFWTHPSNAVEPAPPLALEATIPLEGVNGRIDHMAVDLGRKRLIFAQVDSNTVDVVDLSTGTAVHRIKGLRAPQGVGYAEKADLIVVANGGDGSVRMFRGEDLAPTGSLVLGDDADNVRVNWRDGTVVVGYGRGGLAVIDPVRRVQVADIKLPAHSEGFQIDPDSGLAFVNLPDAQRIAVVDLKGRRVSATWEMTEASAIFPLAFDRDSGLVAVVSRQPPKLALIGRGSGTSCGGATVRGDADDVFFDTKRQRIYIACGSGEVAIFQREGRDLRPLPTVATSPGTRTAFFVPELDRLFVARRATPTEGAAILVYQPEP